MSCSILLGALSVGPVWSMNILATGNMPVRYMDDEDRALLGKAARASLDGSADGQTTSWENPKTGARGELKPVATFEEQGRRCRDLEVANSAKGRSNRLVLTLCRQDDGDWKVEAR
jgi:surface antigen